MTKPLRVLWATNLSIEQDWEVDYIKSILDTMQIPYTLESVKNMNQVVPGALIVLNHSINYLAYLSQYEMNGAPFGVIHLSDEWFDDNVEFYNFSMCKFAFRNYYHERFDRYPKLNYLALSFKIGFWEDYTGKHPREITHAERNYIWSFAGSPRCGKRQHTLELFDCLKPNLVHYEMGNSFIVRSTGLDIPEYRELMMNSKFILCAIGISNTLSGDTGRVTEALECGSIPIVLAGRNSKNVLYWKSLYGEEPPFVFGETWEECLEKTKQLLENPEYYEQTRLACYDFWQNYKKNMGNKIQGLAQRYLLPSLSSI
jgi:hypothetical protein